MDLLPWFRRIPGQEINVRLPSAPNTPKVTIDTVETEREWSTYELAVIGYYNRFGYVEPGDRSIIEDYYESVRPESTRDPQYTDYPDAVNSFTEDYYFAPYAMQIGRWTDETVPQIVRWI